MNRTRLAGALPAPGRNPFPRAALDASIPERFAGVARSSAGRTAIEWQGVAVGYAALDGRAGAVAAALTRAGTAGAGCVALLLPQGPDLIAAMLGVLEAGHAYVPLSPAMPRAASRERVARTEALAVLAGPAFVDAAREVAGTAPVIVLDAGLGAAPTERVRPHVDPDALAYVYFTSGTTGPPRGVMDTHRNVLHNVMRYSNALGFTAADRMTVVQASTFSGVVSSIFGALLNGATLLPYDLAREGAGPPLARWMARARPTIFHAVPSIFRSLCMEGRTYPSVRIVRLEGDAALPRDVTLFRRHFGDDAVLAHGLGTTETGLCAQFLIGRDTPLPADALPVGFATPDFEIAIIGADGSRVPAQTAGEIVVRSRYLAPGYWRDPEGTAAVFSLEGPDGLRAWRSGDVGRLDAEGRLVHLGRRDHRIRMAGEWVDVTALERACAAIPGVAAAAITAMRDTAGEIVLGARLVSGPGARLTWDDVHVHLGRSLPDSVLPADLALIDALPLTAEGKLDRAALATLPARPLPRGVAITAPGSAAEVLLAAIWADLLAVPRIGVHDRFETLGGTSLDAARVLTEIERRIGVTLTMSDLAECRTIAALAARLDAPGARRSATLIRLTRGAGTPLTCVHDLESDAFLFGPLALRLAGRPVHALRFPLDGPVADVPASLAALAARYLADARVVQPAGPWRLAGFCYGAVVALEMARQLAAAGETVERLALLNVTPFDLPSLVSARALRRFRTDGLARLTYLARKRDRWRWLGRRLARVARDRAAAWRDAGSLRSGTPGRMADADAARARLLYAFRSHVARPFTGRVLLALAEETLPLYTDDPASAWRGLSQPAPEIFTVPHDGYAMLSEPEVGALAARLGPWLESEPGARGVAGGVAG